MFNFDLVDKDLTRCSVVSLQPHDVGFISFLSSPPINGSDIVIAEYCRQVFVSLSESSINILRSAGYVVVPIHEVRTAIVSTPTDIIGTYELSPEDTYDILGINKFKLSVTPPLSGYGYSVAVIDTGIRSTHDMIGGKVVYSENFTQDPDGDIFNHGTGVASIIHSAAPDAVILDLKVLGSDGHGTEEGVVLAINKCIELMYTNIGIAPNIINMSLGSVDDGNPYNPVRVACREAMEYGITIIAAAGNDGPDASTITCPASEQYVVAVGSVRKEDLMVSEFSSRGPSVENLTKPDVVFIGEDFIIASSASDSAVSAKSGTSFATPLVSGVMLLTMEGIVEIQDIPSTYFVGKNVLTNRLILEQMLPAVCIKPEGAPKDKDNEYGYGIPVGSAITQTATMSGMIDIAGTITLSITMMMLMTMSKMIMRD